MEYSNININNENERKEFFKLKRELKISKLILYQKNQELKEIIEEKDKLKNENQMIIDKTNQLFKETNDLDEQSKKLEIDIKKKEDEQKELEKRINENKLVPLDDYEEEKFEQINYDNYNIFERDF